MECLRYTWLGVKAGPMPVLLEETSSNSDPKNIEDKNPRKNPYGRDKSDQVARNPNQEDVDKDSSDEDVDEDIDEADDDDVNEDVDEDVDKDIDEDAGEDANKDAGEDAGNEDGVNGDTGGKDMDNKSTGNETSREQDRMWPGQALR